MSHFPPFSSPAIRLPMKDINTDMIFPGRFLTTTSKDGMKQYLFLDMRKQDPEFPLNDEKFRNAKILITGKNFGCGSSREHAPWALNDWGIRAIICSEFADIFRGNAEKNGLLPIIFSEDIVQSFLHIPEEGEFTVDLQEQVVTDPKGTQHRFEISQFSKMRFLEGIDDLDYLLRFTDTIRAFEEQRAPYVPHAA